MHAVLRPTYNSPKPLFFRVAMTCRVRKQMPEAPGVRASSIQLPSQQGPGWPRQRLLARHLQDQDMRRVHWCAPNENAFAGPSGGAGAAGYAPVQRRQERARQRWQRAPRRRLPSSCLGALRSCRVRDARRPNNRRLQPGWFKTGAGGPCSSSVLQGEVAAAEVQHTGRKAAGPAGASCSGIEGRGASCK